MLFKCGVGDNSWESFGLQGDPPVHPKGDSSWVFIGRTDVEAEAPILWLSDMQNQHIRKHSDAGKDLRQEKGATEDELAGWHHWLEGHEFEQALGVVDGQVRLTCCSPWGCKESDMTERLNNNKLYSIKLFKHNKKGAESRAPVALRVFWLEESRKLLLHL